ncbi:MAG: type II/IV secretion system ATPase subunit [Candidatus Hydrothermarchaeales archaeon]
MVESQKAFIQTLGRNPHLKRYVDDFVKKTGARPEFHIQISRDMQYLELPNIIYPVGDPIFIHICQKENAPKKYIAIEPKIRKKDRGLYDQIFGLCIKRVPSYDEPNNEEEYKVMINQLLDDIITVDPKKRSFLSKLFNFSKVEKVYVDPKGEEQIRYPFLKNLVGGGVLEPFLRDPWIEDISCNGLGNMFIIHKIFEGLETNIGIWNDFELDEYCYMLSERMTRPVNDAAPIADGALPDGSRINIIYSRQISQKGSSFTIRKFSVDPLSIVQIVAWGTISAQMAAYLWMCLESGMSLFICGETASGKTTTLNALNVFIPSSYKIFSVEDTPEVFCPHLNWQQTLTRSSGKKGAEADVTMFDLLKAALRSRPNYIIPGEIRGEEGFVAFQAMQTGLPVISTFHAGSVKSMLQRLTGDPINIPPASMSNLNVALIQMAVRRHGKSLRRGLNISEIEGYSRESNGVMTRTMFEWNPANDTFDFKGMYNSLILEDKVGPRLGIRDKREVYAEMDLRTRILEKMVEKEITDFFICYDIFTKYHEFGLDGIPFDV